MMRKKKIFKETRQLLAFLLALMVGVTFIPLFGDGAYAAENHKDVKAAAGQQTEVNGTLAEKAAKYRAEFEKEEVTDMPDIDLGEISGEELEAMMAEGENADADIPQAGDPQEMLSAEDLEAELSAGPPTMDMVDPSASEGVDLTAMLGPADAAEPEAVTEPETIAEPETAAEPTGEAEPETAAEPGTIELSAEGLEDPAQMEACETKYTEADIITIKNNKSTGVATITGQLPAGETFSAMYINDQLVKKSTDSGMGGRTLNQTLYMYNVPVNAYVITVVTSKNRYESDWAITYVYKKPANKISQYEVYHDHFIYSVTSKKYSYDESCKVYVDYKIKGKKWKRKGPMETSKDYNVKKLKSGKKYQVRAYYGKELTINGKKYLILGTHNKNVSKSVSFKTGPKALKFKKVTVKLTNVKKHTQKKYGSLGVYHGKCTWYTCKVKATVKLKKKPGAKGIYINAKRCKGNKKTYTANLGKASTLNALFGFKYKAKQYNWYKSDEYFNLPKGKKYQLMIYSYNSTKYGGYSKLYSKKVKMR